MTRPNLPRRAFVLGMAALAGCTQAPGKKPRTVRIGYQNTGLLLLAKERGALPSLLASAGIGKVQWSKFGSGPLLLEAMCAGALDLGAMGDAPPLFALSTGAPIVYAAAQPLTGKASALLVPAASTIRSVAELKGRRVAFTRGTTEHLFLIRALAKFGLGLKDVTAVNLVTADAVAAFSGGSVDCWAIGDPYLAISEMTQGARTILDGRSVAPTSGFYIASRAFAENTPDALTAVLTALAEEASWGNSHRPEVIEILRGGTDLPADAIASILGHGAYGVVPITDPMIAAQQSNANLLAELGLTPRAVNVGPAAWHGWTPAARPVNRASTRPAA